MMICPKPNPSGITHHASENPENGSNSAIEITPNAPATVITLAGTSEREANKPTAYAPYQMPGEETPHVRAR